MRVANSTPGTGVLATIFSDDGITSTTNPVTTDASGTFSFYVADGRYDLTVNVAGFTKIVADIEIVDITQAATGDAEWITSNLNNVLWVDGTQYKTIAAAYAALPSTGGTVMVPPNYSETMTGSLTLNKQSSGIYFTGPASITMGSNQVIIPVGTQSVFIRSVMPANSGTSKAVYWTYTGTGAAFTVGGSSAVTALIALDDFAIDVTGGGLSAIALSLLQVQTSNFKGLRLLALIGSGSQIGLNLDGTGSFVGDNTFTGLSIFGGINCVKLNLANVNLFDGGVFDPLSTSFASMGFNFTSNSNGNVLNCVDLEQATTGLNFVNSSANFCTVWFESNTTDISFDANSNGNFTFDLAHNASPAVVNSGAGNTTLPGGSYAIDASGNVSTTGTVTTSAVKGPGFQQQSFTSSGTFTIPAGITQVKAYVTAGGGAGGGGTGAALPGLGGGSGGTSIKYLTGLTPTKTITVTVGGGGAGSSGAGGANGVASSISSGTQTITTVTANFGSGGGTAGQQAGTGGTAGSNGTFNFGGTAGGNGPSTDTQVSGPGAPSYWGGGGAQAFANATGGAGSAPGAGGGGGGGNASNTTGGAGAAGIVIFEWVS